MIECLLSQKNNHIIVLDQALCTILRNIKCLKLHFYLATLCCPPRMQLGIIGKWDLEHAWVRTITAYLASKWTGGILPN